MRNPLWYLRMKSCWKWQSVAFRAVNLSWGCLMSVESDMLRCVTTGSKAIRGRQAHMPVPQRQRCHHFLHYDHQDSFSTDRGSVYFHSWAFYFYLSNIFKCNWHCLYFEMGKRKTCVIQLAINNGKISISPRSCHLWFRCGTHCSFYRNIWK